MLASLDGGQRGPGYGDRRTAKTQQKHLADALLGAETLGKFVTALCDLERYSHDPSFREELRALLDVDAVD